MTLLLFNLLTIHLSVLGIEGRNLLIGILEPFHCIAMLLVCSVLDHHLGVAIEPTIFEITGRHKAKEKEIQNLGTILVAHFNIELTVVCSVPRGIHC